MDPEKLAIYSEKKKNPAVIWILFLFLGWSYGSLGSITKQILFYITAGGLGIWILIRLFTLNGSIRQANKEIAMEIGLTNEDLAKLGLIR